MHLDEFGLPVQADGDRNDQLQRVGMILTGIELNQNPLALNNDPAFRATIYNNWASALSYDLQPEPGLYTRYVGGDPANVSADQLISVLCYWVTIGRTKQVGRLFLRCIQRLGFAQNYKDGLDGSSRIKVPDFMLFRALPLFVRAHWILYPLALIVDVLLVLMALSACGPVWRDDKGFSKRSPDDVDDNNTIMTLAVCAKRMPTPLSRLACRLYGKFRPWNFGCRETTWSGEVRTIRLNAYHPVYGALRWYHRKESGGNPEIAELWRPICKELFE